MNAALLSALTILAQPPAGGSPGASPPAAGGQTGTTPAQTRPASPPAADPGRGEFVPYRPAGTPTGTAGGRIDAGGMLDGTWTVVAMERDGVPVAGPGDLSVAVRGGVATFAGGARMPAMRIELGAGNTIRVTPDAGTASPITPAAGTTPASSPAAPASSLGVYIMTRDYLVVSVGLPRSAGVTGPTTAPGVSENERPPAATPPTPDTVRPTGGTPTTGSTGARPRGEPPAPVGAPLPNTAATASPPAVATTTSTVLILRRAAADRR